MMNPRPARGVGRRQFSPGTDEEWDRALSQPHVRRALQDPQVREALIRMMPGAQAPQRLADGGPVGIPDPETVNRWEQLQDEVKSETEPERYQMGGQKKRASASDLAMDSPEMLRDIANDDNYDDQSKTQARLLYEQKTGASTGSAPGLLGVPGASLSGLNTLVTPATMATTGGSALLSGLYGLSVSGPNISGKRRAEAGILGAVLGALGDRIIRHYGVKRQQQQQQSPSSGGSQPSSGSSGSPGSAVSSTDTNAVNQAASSAWKKAGIPDLDADATDNASTTPQTPEEKEQESQQIEDAKERREKNIGKGAQYDQYGFRTDKNPNEPGYPKPIASSDQSYPRSQAPAKTDAVRAPESQTQTQDQSQYGPLPWRLQIPGAENAPIGGESSSSPAASGGGEFWMGREPRTGRDIQSRGGSQWVYSDTGQPYTGSEVVHKTEIFGPSTGDPSVGFSGAPGTPLGPPGYPGTDTIPPWADPDFTAYGHARGGKIEHDDAAQDRAQMLGILKEKNLIKKARGGQFATGAADDSPLPPAKKGKSVLTRKPFGHAIPAPHITIVIAAVPKKKKASKKAKGGKIAKPAAVPPERGPQNGDQYAPYKKGGHVQAPRGSGAALKGKRFSGIY
jgi:hypothetical protein